MNLAFNEDSEDNDCSFGYGEIESLLELEDDEDGDDGEGESDKEEGVLVDQLADFMKSTLTETWVPCICVQLVEFATNNHSPSVNVKSIACHRGCNVLDLILPRWVPYVPKLCPLFQIQ